MSSFTLEELRYKQSRPLPEKIEMSQCLIEMFWKRFDGMVYVSFSGGKDSSVLLDLVRGLFPNVPAVFNDTGLEYPEVKEHVKSFGNLVITRPKLSYRQVIEKYGFALVSKEQSGFIREVRNSKSEKLIDIRMNGNKWGRGKISKKWRFLLDAPFKIDDRCCDILKKNPASVYEKKSKRVPYLGFLVSESSMRQSRWLRYGCNAYDIKRPSSSPLSFWTEQDILEYILLKGLKIPAVYGDIIRDESGKLKTTGVNRTGCMWCLFGIQDEIGENRIQRLKRTHPKIYQYIVDDLKIGDVLNYIGVDYE